MHRLIHLHRRHGEEKKQQSQGPPACPRERSSKGDLTTPSTKLNVLVEAPPIILYGPPASSTGALFSGHLRIAVAELAGEITLNQFELPIARSPPRLLQLHARPSRIFSAGSARAHAQSSVREELMLKLPLRVHRALLPGNEKSSTRSFPPSNLTGGIVRPSVIHPIGKFPVELTLEGRGLQGRWYICSLAPSNDDMADRRASEDYLVRCQKHANKIYGGIKGIIHQATRIIDHGEEKSGWKTDFDTAGGTISMQFEAGINPMTKPACGMKVRGGLEVRHSLVIELIVVQDFYSNRNITPFKPTGAARLLRMQFRLHVTEHSGLGISWDMEMPPVYGDVRVSASEIR
ncbi:hypothetical protein HAV15_011093 [Penicillium sp. str. |nr:hypothetical protein HAV15_011093 [Penicillium sp. str. \